MYDLWKDPPDTLKRYYDKAENKYVTVKSFFDAFLSLEEY
jgi:hypothetical protein